MEKVHGSEKDKLPKADFNTQQKSCSPVTSIPTFRHTDFQETALTYSKSLENEASIII